MITSFFNNLINSGSAFACIKFPEEKNIYLIIQDQKGSNYYSFTSFDSSKKYVFPFSQFNKISDFEWEKLTFSLSNKKNTQTINESNYLRILDKTLHFLQEKNADKIVISREKWVDNSNINPIQSFLFLCKKYPNSFCHLSFWNSEEVWLGATPEILGSWSNSTFKTMALAGTLPDKASFVWENKEIEEQKYVTDYIYKKLQYYSSSISVKGPETLHLGHVKHLITYFSIPLNTPKLLSKLIHSLHPTPAVCGLPLEVSRNFIINEEKYNRDFYAGYIGIETSISKNYFVNLRCGKLYTNGALLFVGGGITAESNPLQEWKETELKAKFITECL